jgi:protein TonB
MVAQQVLSVHPGMERRRRLSTGTALGIGLSVAVHVGIGAFLALSAFEMIQPTFDPEPDRTGSVITLPRTPPKPLPQQTTTVKLHRPTTVPVTVTDTIPVDPPLPVTGTITTIPTATLGGQLATEEQVGALEPVFNPVITHPDWIRKPSAAQMERVFPERAIRMGVSGKATLACLVAANGSVGSCDVVSEDPGEFRLRQGRTQAAALFPDEAAAGRRPAGGWRRGQDSGPVRPAAVGRGDGGDMDFRTCPHQPEAARDTH